MKTVFLASLLFCATTVAAQKEKFVKIDMPELPIADFPEDAIPVSEIRVIQTLADSIRMGYAHKGLDYSIATLIFKKPLTEILQKQVNRMYKHEYKKGGATLFWVIKDLRFGAKVGYTGYTSVSIGSSSTNDYSYTRFNADAYISLNGNLFKKVCTVDTVFLIMNMAGGHGPDLENALRVLLKRTLLTGKVVLEKNGNEFTVEQIADQSTQEVIAPVLNDSIYREGAYASYAEFLANDPSVKNYETVTDKKKKVTLMGSEENNKKDTLKVWGICKNGEIYKYHNQSLIPIEKRQSGFVISGYVENTTRHNRNNANIGMAVHMGAGVFMNNAIFVSVIFVSGKPLLVDSIPYINDPKAQPVATCIDMRTGNFSF